jgi:hypothetical protein
MKLLQSKNFIYTASFLIQLGVTFQQSLVLGNTSHYPINTNLMIGDYVAPGSGGSLHTYRH